jgi:hypothetical protein
LIRVSATRARTKTSPWTLNTALRSLDQRRSRYVAFESTATNLAEDDMNGLHDIFVRDLDGQDVQGIVDRLLGEQMADGWWNCELENGLRAPAELTS